MPVPRKLEAVLWHYDTGTCRTAQKIERGYVNETWLVETTTGCYVLKRRHPVLRQAGLVAAQHALIEYLHSAGFPAPRTLRARSGRTFLELGEDVYELQDYIPGKLCDRARPAHIAAAARTLGLYHRLVSGFDHPALHRSPERFCPAMLEGILGHLSQDSAHRPTAQTERVLHRLASHARQLATHLGQLDRLPQLVIHGDYYAENIIFSGDRVVGVVDYDQARWSARVQEVAEAVIYFAQERTARFGHIVYSGVLELDTARRFLAAYADIVSLSDTEIRALPHAVRVTWLCASLDPPLHPRLRLHSDLEALHEVLALADWGRTRASDIAHIGFEVFRTDREVKLQR